MFFTRSFQHVKVPKKPHVRLNERSDLVSILSFRGGLKTLTYPQLSQKSEKNPKISKDTPLPPPDFHRTFFLIQASQTVVIPQIDLCPLSPGGGGGGYDQKW